jgi:uncharacterized protein involved in outer membrane biogenesis
MKKWIIRIGLVVAMLVIAAVVVVFLSLNTIVKKGVETVGPQLTKATVTLGSANISPLSGSGQLHELFVGNPEGFKTPSAIKVGDIKVAVAIGSVMSDTIKIKEIKISAPEITLDGGLSGNNISKILDNVNAAIGGEPPAAKSDASAPKAAKKFFVEHVVVEGGKINLSTSLLGGKELTVPLPTLDLQNIGTENAGVTAGELVKQILKPLLASVTKAAENGIADLGKTVTNVKGAGEQLKKVGTGFGDGVKSLFK